MSRVNFTELWSPNEDITRLQSHIKTVLSPLLDLPISDGVLVKSIDIETTDTLVEHKLGREFEGFIITKLNANSVIYESSSDNFIKNRQIILKGSATANVDIYFF